jgi:O-methyltransferase involved in polyketide biosynthesis
MVRAHPETISPTAHYTGFVWYAHGQSHRAFATPAGRLMYHLLRAPNAIAHRLGMASLEGMLLARHRLIDLRLAQAIDAGEIEQVVEIAAGLSPRGWRFATRYADRITYVEADLPAMIAHKRRILQALGGETAHHRTAEIDALADLGPTSLAAICATLDPTRGIAVITEGLVNYFERDVVLALWQRIAAALRRFPRSVYLSDLMLRADNRGPLSAGFSWLLSAFVRGRVHLQFETAEQAEDALESAGLIGVLCDPRDFAFELDGIEPAGAARVRIIEAIARRETAKTQT